LILPCRDAVIVVIDSAMYAPCTDVVIYFAMQSCSKRENSSVVGW